MFFLKDYISSENEIVKFKKARGRVFLSGFLLLMGFLTLPASVYIIMDNIINVKLNFELMSYYVTAIFGSFCLILSVGFFLSYFLNKIVITNSHIIIRRGALGKVYIIPKSLILAKLPVFTSSKGIDNYQILFSYYARFS